MNQAEAAFDSCGICCLNLPAAYEVFAGDLWRVRHSQETNILGYCILEPRRHFLDLSEARREEIHDYGLLLAQIMKAQREILECQRVYTFSLAEAVPHFHVHVIPRAKEFVQAFKGRGIMSYPVHPAADANLVENVVEALKGHFRRNPIELSNS